MLDTLYREIDSAIKFMSNFPASEFTNGYIEALVNVKNRLSELNACSRCNELPREVRQDFSSELPIPTPKQHFQEVLEE